MQRSIVKEMKEVIPPVDDIYDELLLTDPNHQLSSLNKDELLHKML